MVSEVPEPSVKEVNMASEKPIIRSSLKKKNHGKISRKVHKSEMEKLKREHLNELFLELGNALETTRQNNGKASILDDTTRLLQELLSQVESLKKENAALLNESHYVIVEKDELKDENCVLEADIKELQMKLQERIQLKPAWNAVPPRVRENQEQLAIPIFDPTLESPPVLGRPVFVIPLPHDGQVCPETETAQVISRRPSNVSRPHARYPTPSDSWPLQLLAEQSRPADQ